MWRVEVLVWVYSKCLGWVWDSLGLTLFMNFSVSTIMFAGSFLKMRDSSTLGLTR